MKANKSITQTNDLHIDDEELKNLCLIEIEKFLQENGRSLKEFPCLPYPKFTEAYNFENRFVADELNYNKDEMLKIHEELVCCLTLEQDGVYKNVLNVVLSDNGGFFFLYGFGGTEKTYVWNTLSAALRSRGFIVLNVASSGIASLLLPGGRTAHSRFSILISINEISTCNLRQGSPKAESLKKASLIIWDEAPMLNKHCFEALDRSLNDIMKTRSTYGYDIPFGGKVVYLSCDTSRRSDEDSGVNAEWFTSEFLNDYKCSGIPKHQIKLKVGVPIMLIRNIDQVAGLCNGTRMIVNVLTKYIIVATVLNGNTMGETTFIPRMSLTPSNADIRFKFQRRQFPVTFVLQ
ncbi:uncharacterized protein LOC130744679 [Lotus japonicus]|uniref:uncharacterized protein LOC130744679 n=1 Tax=Lotus japonicus TaxID=34305 RepID=UPI00258CAA4B|nr:uncharacterized protein LOC130744679 [Lotus japonicus]